MIRTLWRITRGYRLTPWKSPYLRWRLETYWGMHAEGIRFADFWNFTWTHWRDFVRYLCWSARYSRL